MSCKKWVGTKVSLMTINFRVIDVSLHFPLVTPTKLCVNLAWKHLKTQWITTNREDKWGCLVLYGVPSNKLHKEILFIWQQRQNITPTIRKNRKERRQKGYTHMIWQDLFPPILSFREHIFLSLSVDSL